MTFATIYLRAGTAYIPVQAKTEAGFFLEVEPVEVVEIANEKLFEDALRRVVTAGHPAVPTPSRNALRSSVIVARMGMKSVRQLEREAEFWGISGNPGGWAFGLWKRKCKGWEPDPDRETRIAGNSNVDQLVRRVVSAVLREHEKH